MDNMILYLINFNTALSAACFIYKLIYNNCMLDIPNANARD